ncbi:lycopene cyclase domain-containing protein [uncultured Jatrophihabitans sp.]|uniref:lycopene cyclase domain-containing protein n=1 Tax=uncultured Jatrophihabitans sp. TaxID=1610747 RepID=UPI0035CABB73
MTYTLAALLAVAAVAALDLAVLRTRLLGRRAFWTAYGIVLFFQLVVNGLLTGLRIVRYDPAEIVGLRIVYAPVEDLLFGFALVLATLSLWVWTGRLGGARGGPGRRAGRRPVPRRRGAAARRSPGR